MFQSESSAQWWLNFWSWHENEYPINICINIRIIEIHVLYLYAICMDNNAWYARATSIQFSFFSAAFYLYLTPTTTIYCIVSLIPLEKWSANHYCIIYAEIDQQTHEMNFRECGNWFSGIWIYFFLLCCKVICVYVYALF